MTQDTAENLLKSIDALPAALQPATATATAAPPTAPALTEAMAKFEALPPSERALMLLKATPGRRFDIRSAAPAVEGTFGR